MTFGVQSQGFSIRFSIYCKWSRGFASRRTGRREMNPPSDDVKRHEVNTETIPIVGVTRISFCSKAHDEWATSTLVYAT